jgi:cell division septation protein DedD
MIRIVVLGLVLANLLFFGWSHWVGKNRAQLQAVAAVAHKPAPAPAPPPPPPPCATVGPFTNELATMTAQKHLEAAGWGVSRRDATRQVKDGYWVYIGNLKDRADQADVLDTLRRANIRDAFAMPSDSQYRVSVGIFSEQAGAEDRAKRVRALKLDAQVTERQRDNTSIWLDVPGVAAAALSDGRLAAANVDLTGLRIETCP